MHRYLRETRVLVADPHPVVCVGLRSLFENAGGIRVVAEASSGFAVLPLIEETKPDVLILAMELPGVSGVTIAQRLKAMNGEEAVQLVAEQRPNVVVMDLQMPVMDGVAATRLIRLGGLQSR